MTMTVLPVLIDLAAAVSSVLLITGLVRLRRRGSGGQVHDAMEGAFLAGGPGRAVDAAIAGMQAEGRLIVGGPGIVMLRPSEARNAVELAVVQGHAAAPSGALHTLRHAVMRSRAVQELGDALAARGLLVPPAAARRYTRWGSIQGVLGFIGVPLSFILAISLTVNDSATGFGFSAAPFSVPLVFVVSAVIGLVCATVARKRITKSGQTALRSFRTQYAHATSADYLVALGGLRALPDPLLRRQLLLAGRMPSARGFGAGQDSVLAPIWCASAAVGSGCGASTDNSPGGGGGGGCGSGSSGCGSGGSSCGGSSGSSCGSSSGGSSCSSSSGSSCGSSS
jgi:uncharacterized protein (TIGR04222 family)